MVLALLAGFLLTPPRHETRLVVHQECTAGVCQCKEGSAPCATRGGRCLELNACPAFSPGGSVTDQSGVNIDLGTQNTLSTNNGVSAATAG